MANGRESVKTKSQQIFTVEWLKRLNSTLRVPVRRLNWKWYHWTCVTFLIKIVSKHFNVSESANWMGTSVSLMRQLVVCLVFSLTFFIKHKSPRQLASISSHYYSTPHTTLSNTTNIPCTRHHAQHNYPSQKNAMHRCHARPSLHVNQNPNPTPPNL